MNNESAENLKQSQGGNHGPEVIIQVDNVSITIHRGHQTVIDIKQLGKVPLAYDLEQVVNGILVLLLDDGSLTIKGDEIFVSHPKDSSSS